MKMFFCLFVIEAIININNALYCKERDGKNVFRIMQFTDTHFGKNETLPVYVSVWLPQIIMFLICMIGLTRLNEN